MNVYTILEEAFLLNWKNTTGQDFIGNMNAIASIFNIPGIQKAVDRNIREANDAQLAERHQRNVLQRLVNQFVAQLVQTQTYPPNESQSASDAKVLLKSAGCPYFPC